MEILILAVIAFALLLYKDVQIIRLEEERDKWKRLYNEAIYIAIQNKGEQEK